MRRSFAAVGLIMWVCVPAHAADAMRLAVVPSQAARATGLADLLALELAKAEGVELVERDAIRTVAAEIALTKTLGTKAVADRRALGVALKADVLVCLDADGPSAVRVVVCDSRTGIRLGTAVVPVGDKPDEKPKADLAPTLAAFVLDLRARFPNGVIAAVGLTPFACGNLTHEFDHLGRVYADLLGEAVSARSGIAVLELEEARAIQVERTLTGDGKAALTAAFVDCEYTVTREKEKGKGKETEPTVALRVRVTTAGGDRPEVRKAGVPLVQVGAVLRGEAADAVVAAVATKGTSLPADKQFAALVARADRFARVGAFETSARIREAAVLVDPTAHAQRKLLMEAYARVGAWEGNRVPIRERYGSERKQVVDPEGVAREVLEGQVRLTDWRHSLDHLEVLVRTGQVSLKEALDGYVRANGQLGTGVRLVGTAESAAMANAREFQIEFVRHVFPSMGRLKPGTAPRNVIFVPNQNWEYALFNSVVRRPDYQRKIEGGTVVTRTNLTRADLDFGLEALRMLPDTERYPDGSTVGMAIGEFVQAMAIRQEGSDRYISQFTEDDADAALKALEASSRPMIAQYARLGRAWSAWEKGGKTPALADAVRRAADDFTAVVTAGQERVMAGHEVARVHQRIGFGDDTQHRFAVKGPLLSAPARSHKPIEIQVRDVSGKEQPLSAYKFPSADPLPRSMNPKFVCCGEGLDIYLTQAAVYAHRVAGRFDEVVVDRGADFVEVVWDGKAAWVSSRRKGLWIIGPSGDVVGQVNAGDLPPADKAIDLLPLAPGRVIASGAFGEHSRAWVALVERGPADEIKVRKLHEAKRVWSEATDAMSSAVDTAWTFMPGGLAPLPDGGVIVFRHAHVPTVQTAASNRFSDQLLRHPLRIDPTQPGATIYRPGPALSSELARGVVPDNYLANGTLICGPMFIAPQEKLLPNGLPSLTTCQCNNQVVPHGGKLYFRTDQDPARGSLRSWFRVDSATFRTEWLGYEADAYGHRLSVSAHLGLVVWSEHSRKFYQVDPTILLKTDEAVVVPRQPAKPGPAVQVRKHPDGRLEVFTEYGWLNGRPEKPGGDNLIATVGPRVDKSPAETRALQMGIAALISNPDARKAMGLTAEQWKKLQPFWEPYSKAWEIPNAASRALELFRAYDTADLASKASAEKAFLAHMAAYQTGILKELDNVPAHVRAILTSAQFDAVLELSHGVLYLGGRN